MNVLVSGITIVKQRSWFVMFIIKIIMNGKFWSPYIYSVR